MSEFSMPNVPKNKDIFCIKCGGISEEINPNNDPREFYGLT